MRIRRHVACAVALLAFVLGIAAYPQAGTGTVTGTVYCSDTQKPARFVSIRLQPLNSQGVRGGMAITGSDGSFRITGVQPGDYYADVSVPGYLQPLRGAARDVQELSPAERDRLNSLLTRVSVTAGGTASVQVTIYRGATISGSVSFDDGSPAAGIPVRAMSAVNATGSGSFATTDDRGHFRLNGLSDGTYLVAASPRTLFPIYFGNTIDRSKAKKLEVRAGEEVSGTDLIISSGGMHRVSGVVMSRQDGLPVSRPVLQLRLNSTDGNSITTIGGADGSFSFSAVPDGSFLLQVLSGGTGVTESVEVNGTDLNDLVIQH